MTALVDTDVLIDILRGTPAAQSWLASAPTTTFAIPGVVAMELVIRRILRRWRTKTPEGRTAALRRYFLTVIVSVMISRESTDARALALLFVKIPEFFEFEP